MLEKRIKKDILLIATLALIIRAFFLIIFPLTSILEPSSNALHYDTIALNNISGKGMITGEGEVVTSEPLYSLFLSLIYKIFGHSHLAVILVQSVLFILICILVYLIGKELFNRKIGWIAGLLAVFYPCLIIGAAGIWTEPLFVFLLTLLVFFSIKIFKKLSFKYSLTTGIVLGLSILTKEIMVFFPILILVFLIFYHRKLAFLKYFIIILVAMILVMSLWVIRNYFVVEKMGQADLINYKKDRSVIENVAAGYVHQERITNLDLAKGPLMIKRIISDKNVPLLLISGFYKLYRAPFSLLDIKTENYKEALNRFIFERRKFKELFPIFSQGTFWLKIVIFLYYLFILFTALIGLTLGYKYWKKFLPLIFIILYISLPPLVPSLVVEVVPRYKFPIMPLIIVLSGYGAWILWQKFFKKNKDSYGKIT